MSRGKVETISRLARWRVGRIDTVGPWSTLGSTSFCLSDTFTFGIWEWFLKIEKMHFSQNMSIALLVKETSASNEKLPFARFVLRVFNTDSGSCPYISAVDEKHFHPNGFGYSWTINYTPHGTFIIDVEFLELQISDLLHGGHGHDSSIWSDEGMMQSLAARNTLPFLSHMLEDGIHADVTINTSDGVLKAHKSVLSANSPVFHSMFMHDLKEKETSTIDIEDMSLESCMAMLRYMYGTIKQEEFMKRRLTLLIGADNYGMTYLKDYCEESLVEDVCSINVLQRLQDAWFYRLHKLKKRCFMYLFDLGKVYDVGIDNFFIHADQELKSEMFQQITKVWKPPV